MLDTPNFVTIWNVFYIFRYSLITDFAEIFILTVVDGFSLHDARNISTTALNSARCRKLPTNQRSFMTK